MKNLEYFYNIKIGKIIFIIFTLIFVIVEVLINDVYLRYELKIILFTIVLFIALIRLLCTYLFDKKELLKQTIIFLAITMAVILYIFLFKPNSTV
jgi:hypothetical protein